MEGMADDDRSDRPSSAAGSSGSVTGVRFGVVNAGRDDDFLLWARARARAFHEPDVTGLDDLGRFRATRDRELRVAWDDGAAHPEIPVATLSAWDTSISIPGALGAPTGRIQARAISAVSVAPTHRRRGIARSLLTNELSDAHRRGVPIAVLTATDAAIYGRFGFGPATRGADYSLDTRRARWTTDRPAGRVEMIDREELRPVIARIDAEAAEGVAGEIERWDDFYDRLLGLTPDRRAAAASVHAVRYVDAGDVPRGYALYRVVRNAADPRLREASIIELVAASDDAYVSLWRFMSELDLVDRVVARLRDVDEPLRWMLEDPEAVTRSNERDQLWIRILDPIAALSARGWSAPDALALTVSDPLGHASGVYLITVSDSGLADVGRVESVPDGHPHLSLGVAELGAVLLGGASTRTLERAGRVHPSEPGLSARFDRMLAAERPPRLSSLF
jgi:predicted acetyltransferase